MEYLIVTEAMSKFRASRNTVYRWIKEGKLPSVRVGGKILIPVDAVDAMLRGDK